MSISYTYEVIESTNDGMVLQYNSPGRDPVIVGTPLPTADSTVDDVAWMYSPVNVWINQDLPRIPVSVGTAGSFTAPAEPEVTLESAKAEKLVEAAAWRFIQEVSGIDVNGASIKTDRESQATIASAFTSLKEGLISGVSWKTANGTFVTLGLTEITAVAQAVAAHVQACFSAEALIVSEVQAATTIEAVQAITFPDTVV